MYTIPLNEVKALEEQNSEQLASLIIERGQPANERSQALQAFSATQLGLKRSQMTRLLDDLMPNVTASKDPKIQKSHRECLRLIICALVAAGYSYEWLAMPSQDKHFKAGIRSARLGLSRRRVNRVFDALDSDLMIRGRKGYLDLRLGEKTGKASQYYPSAKLLSYFARCLYEFEAKFDLEDKELIKFNGFSSDPSLEQFTAQINILRDYNEFMQQFSWAHKGPTIRVFSKALNRGGRLHTPYQNLPKNSLPIRQNTLLNGLPIVEPDFSCNQLRMAGALLGQELSEDPYEEVAQEASLERHKVKAFLVRVLGAAKLRSKGGLMMALNDEVGVSKEEFHAIEKAFKRIYPWIEREKIFYNDTGARMQKYEGDIALEVFEAAVKTGIPILSVHDAFATQELHAKWVSDCMANAWMKVLNTTVRPVIRTH